MKNALEQKHVDDVMQKKKIDEDMRERNIDSWMTTMRCVMHANAMCDACKSQIDHDRIQKGVANSLEDDFNSDLVTTIRRSLLLCEWMHSRSNALEHKIDSKLGPFRRRDILLDVSSRLHSERKGSPLWRQHELFGLKHRPFF